MSATECEVQAKIERLKKTDIRTGVDVDGYVYCVRAIGTGLVKIGFSTVMAERVKLLQAASPVELEVVGCVRGGRAKEYELHERFKGQVHHSEWFEESPELISVFENGADVDWTKLDRWARRGRQLCLPQDVKAGHPLYAPRPRKQKAKGPVSASLK